MKYLASEHPDRWGVTLFEAKLRLDSRWVECLVLNGDALRVLVIEKLAARGSEVVEHD